MARQTVAAILFLASVLSVLAGTNTMADDAFTPGPAASRQAIVRDWMLQDYMSIRLPEELEREKRQWQEKHLVASESKADAPVLKNLGCFVSERDAVVERRMMDRVLTELGAAGDESRRANAHALLRAAAWLQLPHGNSANSRSALRPLPP